MKKLSEIKLDLATAYEYSAGPVGFKAGFDSALKAVLERIEFDGIQVVIQE